MLRLAPRVALAAIVAAGVVASALLWTVDGHVNAQQANRVPEFPKGDSAVRVVAEGTPASQNVGEPVEAADPGDTLTYSLAGDDAGHFAIGATTGQILTRGALSYDTQSSYLITVQVSDGADDLGLADDTVDDSIEVTIRVSVAIDLTDWTAEDYDSDTQYCASGTWAVDSNGRAKETRGQAPSILHGDFDAYGKRLTATVHPGNDDDFFGFVVGFNSGDSTNADANYLLMDWKKSTQDFNFSGDSTSPGGEAEVGLRLSHVTGMPDCDEFWQHANLDGTPDASGVEELQKGASKGDSRYDRQNYEFVIDFGSGSIEVYLDGRLELDLDGEFSDGRFGTYAMLHNSATFWDFSYTDGSFLSVNEPVDQPGEVSLSSTTSEVGVALTALLTDPDGGVVNKEWQWESSPDQDPPTWTMISGATSASYTPTTTDVGKLLRALVTYDDATGTGRTAVSAPTAAADRVGTVSLSTDQPVVGEVSTATLTDADGSITNQVWVWESSPDEDPLDWSVISGADSATYTPVTLDAGRLLRGGVTYDDGVGTGRSVVSAATAAVDQRGAVTLSPTTPVVGEAVTAVLVDADGGVTNEVWEWERSPGTGDPAWAVISGATSSSYTPTASDDAGKRLRVTVGYTDGTGSGRSAISVATDRVDRRGVVTLSTNVPDVGIELAATLADVDGGVTGEVWQWQRSAGTGTPSWSDISDADEASYTPVMADEGMVLRAKVSYDDAIGSARSAISTSTDKVGKSGEVSLGSTAPVVSAALVATLTDADGSIADAVWQWESSPAQPDPVWSPIAGANSASYIPLASDAGKRLRLVVTYTDGSGAGRMAGSAPTGRVDQVGIVTVSPQTPVVRKAVKATLSDPDGMEANQVWRWERSPYGIESELVWTVIAGAQTNSYTPVVAEDSGKLLRVMVTYDDGTGMGRTATSSATERVDREGMLELSPSPPVAGQAVTATLTDADGMVSNQEWKWERSPRTGAPDWEEITGAPSATYTPTAVDDGGKILRVTVGYDDAFGTGRGAVSPSTLPVDLLGVVSLSTTTPVAGELVTATLTDGDGGVLNAVWKWESSPDEDPPEWVAISGAESATYTPSASLAGKLLRAVVTYDDATGMGREAASDATAPLDQRGTISLSSNAPVVGEAVAATLTDADGDVTNQAWAWERSPDQEQLMWSTITKADGATYTAVVDDAGQVLRAMVSYDDAVGTGREAVSAVTAAVDQKGAVTLSPQEPVVGEAVTATLTDADGDITSQAWRWERSPGTGELEWSAIGGAESSSYIPIAPDDAGKLLRVTVAYTDGTGSGRGTTSAPTERVDQRGAVTLSTRVPDVGIAVTATLADADGNVTGAVWQWQRSAGTGTPSWGDISDADAAAYTPVAVDEGMALRATVSYDDEVGTGRSAVSASTQKVGKPGEVSLDSTIPVVGVALMAKLTDADGNIADAMWQWESSPAQPDPVWSSIADASAASYIPVAGDAGGLLRATVVYTDGSGAGRMSGSAPTGRVDQLGIVTVSPQTPVVGKQTRSELVDPDGSISGEMWRWERSAHGAEPELVWAAIARALSNSYMPVAANDSGMLLRVVVTYNDGTGSGRTATSDPTNRVDQEGMVTLSPSPPIAGVAVTAALADPDGLPADHAWKWERSSRAGTPDWRVITGAKTSAYTPSAEDDGGKILRVTVGYEDAIGTGRSAVSPSTLPVDRLGLVSLSATTPVVGEALTATLTDGDGGVLNAGWKWENSPDQDPPEWIAISGAENATYTPSASLAGKLLRAVVTYDDATGRGRTASSDGTAALDQRGTIALSSDAPVVGDEIRATLEDLDGGITNKVWQWESSPDDDEWTWSVITGAGSDAYTAMVTDAGQVLRATVSYDDAVGSGRMAVSAATAAVDQKGAVTLSPQQPVVGETVTATLTDADGDITSQAWQWERSPGTGELEWSAISGAQSASYTPTVPEDAGKLLRVVVAYSDSTGSGRGAASAPTDRVDQPGEVTLSTEVPDVGIAVTATLADADGNVTGAVWQWQRSAGTGTPSWGDISDADEASYKPVAADEGKSLRTMVSYDDAIGSARSAISTSTQKVGKPGAVSLDSTIPVVGDELTATLTDPDGSLADLVWQWENSLAQPDPVWSSIADANSASYPPVAGDAGKRLWVVVTYTDGSGSDRTAGSAPTGRVDQVGTVTISTQTPVVGKAVKATLSDPDGIETNQVWRWERSPYGTESELVWMAIAGAQSISYKPVASEDSGNVLRVVVTYDDGTGTGRTATSSATERVDRAGTISVTPSPPVAGQAVTATLTDADGMVSNQVWKWERSPRSGTPDWGVITGATTSAYTPSAQDDGGKILWVTVGYDDAFGTGRGAVSPSTLPVDRLGLVSLSATTPVVGEALTATLTDGNGGVLNAVWKWESSPDEDPPEWVAISGAENAMYTPSAALAGKLLRVVVTYDDATGRGRTASSDGTAALDQRGTITLSSDAPVAGDEIRATLEDLDGDITNKVWQWESSPGEGERTWSVITGAGSDAYTTTVTDAGRVVRAMVSYDDAVGTGRLAVSAATAAVDQKGAVTLSPQQPVVGEAVTATLTDADGDVTSQAWKWERFPGIGILEWSVISEAESPSYTPTAPQDAGKLLRVVVTYTDGTGSGRGATSAPTERVDQRGAVTPSTEVPDVGIAVTATLADPDGNVTGAVWQWQSSVSTGTPLWSDISDADEAAYTPVGADEGMALRAAVSYDDAIGSARSAVSASTQKVGKPGEVSLDATIPVVDVALAATLTDADGTVANQVWQWKSSSAQSDPVWSPIADANLAHYTPVAGDAGKRLRVVVAYTDGSGSGRMATASASMRVDRRGTVSVKSRNMMVDMPEVGVWQDAELIDPDGKKTNQVWRWEISPYGTESERVWMPVPGAQSSSYKPVEGDAGKVLRMTVTYDDGAGSGKRAISLSTERVDQPGTVDLSTYTELAVGKEVIATLSDLDKAARETWQWYRSPKQDQAVWADIDGAVFDAYTPTDADGAKILRVTVTYDDGVGLGRTAESPSTGVVDRPGVVTLSTQTPEAGEMMEATLADGDEEDGGIRNVRWHWESSTASGDPSWAPIAGTELAAYNPPLSLAGMILRAVATYDDATAKRTAAGVPTGPLGSPGVVTLDSVEPVVGTAVTATLADLDDGVTDDGVTDEAWRWERSPNHPVLSWTPIPGAVLKSYAPSPRDAGMVLSATVVYNDALATGRMAWSGATAAVDQPGEVNLSPLEPEVGEPVRAMLVDLDEGVTGETWEWHRSSSGNSDDWLVIVGVVAGSYIPMTGDAGYRLRAMVSYSDNTGSGRSATSGPTAPVYQPGTVVLSPDAPKVGEPVTARFSHPESVPEDQTWSWESSPGTGEHVWSIIDGATEASYTPVAGDAGRVLRAEVSYRDGNGTNRSAASGPTARVDQRGMVTLSPSMPVVGETVTAMLTDGDEPITNKVWLWERSSGMSVGPWDVIEGTQSVIYTPVAPNDVGEVLRVTVTYDDKIWTGRTAVSPPTDRVNQRGAVGLSSNVPDVGVQLTATLTDPDGMVTNAEWQWKWSLSSGMQSWSDVPGAEGATYSPKTAHEGMLLRATVVYDDAIGGGRVVASPATGRVGKPGVVSLDSIVPVVGAVLSAMLSDVDVGVDNEMWHWERSAKTDPSWEAIPGAESSSYIPQASDATELLRAIVVYTDATGDGRTASSAATAQVDQAGTVTMSPRTPVVGKPTGAELVDADGNIKGEMWRWERSPHGAESNRVWTTIPGALSNSYTPVASEDAGVLLRVVVTYDDRTGSGRTAISEATERVDQEGTLTLRPSLPVAGVAVMATLADPDGMLANHVWKWERSPRAGTPDWEVIIGATASTYTPTAEDDDGKLLRVIVAYDDALGGGRVAISPSTLPVDRPGVVSLSTETPVVGESVTGTLTDDDGGVLNEMWQWEVSPDENLLVWEVVSGATTVSYTPLSRDAGKLLRAMVTYEDATGMGLEAVSNATAPLDQRGTVTLRPNEPLVGEAVTATLTDADGGVTNSVWVWQSPADQEELVWDAITRAHGATYTPVLEDTGKLLRATVTYDDGTGSGRSAMSPPTLAVDQLGVVGLSTYAPIVGEVVVGTLTDADGDITNELWQWESSPLQPEPVWTSIVGAESPSYTPQAMDAGELLRATVRYDDGTDIRRSAISLPTVAVDQLGSVGLSTYAPVVGEEVVGTLTDSDGDLTHEAWQWESSPELAEAVWTPIVGAESCSYTPLAVDAGRLLRVTVIYGDGTGIRRLAISPPTVGVDQLGVVGLSTYAPIVGEAVVGTLSDADSDVANETWQWESSPDQPEPVWAPIVGAMSHMYIPESSNHGNLLRATVAYDDGTGTGRQAASVAAGPVVGPAVIVTLSPSGADAAPAVVLFNFPPSFAEGGEASREIAIGWPGARAGVPVMATDLNGDGLTYLLTGKDSAFFEVDPASGQVRIAKRLIYLRPGVYQVTLHAADPKGGVGSLVLSITVLQLTVPVFGEGTVATRSVPENSPVDTVVGFPVQATDPDGDTLAYSLSGTDELAFRVDAGTGQIRTREILDREIRPTYKVEVGVEDGRGGQDSIDVNIEVSDVNEPPILSSLISTDFIVGENSPSGTAVGEPFTALDPEEDRLAYFLSGDDASAFEIGTNTGQVMTKERLDHESRTSYGMKVGVKDGRGGSDEVGLSIEVTDVNEAPTFSRETVVVLALPENSPAGAVVGEPLLANDPEGDTLAYSLSGDGSGAFAMEAKTGLMVAKRPFDFESRSSYLVRVTAGDGMGGDSSIYVTVNVMDVEELVPETPEEAISKSTTSADVLPASHADTVPDVIAPVDIMSSDSTDDLSTGAGTAANSRSDSGPASPFTDFSDTRPEAAVVTTEVVAPVEDWEPVAVSEEGPEVDDTAGVAPTIVLSEGSISEAPPVAPPPVVPVVVRPVTAPQPFPLWLVLVIVALVCLDGIVLATLFYRVWGRPRPR